MSKKDIKAGLTYNVNLGRGQMAPVLILGRRKDGGWVGLNQISRQREIIFTHAMIKNIQ